MHPEPLPPPALARAQHAYDLDVVAVSAVSSHYHLLAVLEDQEQLSAFMCFVNANLSKEVGKLYDWQGSMWPGVQSARR